MDIVSLVLGIIIALVVVEAAALVVVLLKMKSIKKVEEDVIRVIDAETAQLSSRVDDMDAELDRKAGELFKDFKGAIETLGTAFKTDLNTERRDRTDNDQNYLIAAKAYTDSRFDKGLLGGKR